MQQAQVIVQEIAATVQQKAHKHFQSLVSKCLTTVFGDRAYAFKIDFLRKRGKTEARLVFVRGKNDVHPASGGGVGQMDVAAFALRIASIMLVPGTRRFLCMDEPFRHVHGDEYRRNVRLLLETLAKELKFQFVMSTGTEEFLAGKAIEL